MYEHTQVTRNAILQRDRDERAPRTPAMTRHVIVEATVDTPPAVRFFYEDGSNALCARAHKDAPLVWTRTAAPRFKRELTMEDLLG